MGWDSTRTGVLSGIRKELHMLSEIEGSDRKVIAYHVTAGEIYAAVELKDGRRYIHVALYEQNFGQPGWFGMKHMSEDCGPYCYSCPASLLKLVPEPEHGYAKDWRAKVRELNVKAALKYPQQEVARLF